MTPEANGTCTLFGSTPRRPDLFPGRRLGLAIQGLNLSLLLGCLLTLATWVVPAVDDLGRRVKDQRREDAEVGKTLELSRALVLRQQAEAVARQEALRRLTEENLRLAGLLNERLKGPGDDDGNGD